MLKHIVFTFIGEDKPGLVKRLADVISSHGGNWLESNMSQLAGKFTGIVLIAVDDSETDNLCQALQGLKAEGLTIVTEHTNSDKHTSLMEIELNIIGPDRPGIVKSVSQALEKNNINVKQMESRITSAAMSGDPMFEADVVVQVADQVDIDALVVDINEISLALGIDINLA
ncbi:MAG TPA: ACT domain-containing protein [Pseudomonadales bacterium]|nr:ACT domain-containing protein [Pseudomonadales bacterium]